MNNRININHLNIHSSVEHLRRVEPQPAVKLRAAEPERLEPKPAAKPEPSPQEVRHRLLARHRQATVAIGAVNQLTDLVTQVKERLQEPETRASHLAQERLVQSARDTARDIVAHARTDAGPLFGQSPVALAPSVSRQAVQAYARTAAFQAEDQDSPGLNHALSFARANITGNQGVLVRLDRIEATSEQAPHELQSVADTLQTVRSRFAHALENEILPALNPYEQAS